MGRGDTDAAALRAARCVVCNLVKWHAMRERSTPHRRGGTTLINHTSVRRAQLC